MDLRLDFRLYLSGSTACRSWSMGGKKGRDGELVLGVGPRM